MYSMYVYVYILYTCIHAYLLVICMYIHIDIFTCIYTDIHVSGTPTNSVKTYSVLHAIGMQGTSHDKCTSLRMPSSEA